MLKNSEPMSFEDLGAIYRVEKKSPTLSSVRKDLYPSMAGLVIALKAEYEKCLSVDPDSIICEGVNQRRKKAVSLSKEITEMRMSKIASLALIGARGGQNVLDHLTPEEKEYYEDVLNISRRHVNIMDRLSGKRRFETPEIDNEPVAEKKTAPVTANVEATEPEITDIEGGIPIDMADDILDEPPASEEDIQEDDDELVVIRVLEDLPPFSGPDRNYELSKEDIVRMPKTMAMALVNREKAVIINYGP